MPEPDEAGERYIARWDAWVSTVDPASVGRAPMRAAMEKYYEMLSEVSELGDWDTRSAIGLSKPGDEDWEATVSLFELLEPQFEAMSESLSADWFVGFVESGDSENFTVSAASSDIVGLIIDSAGTARSGAARLADRARHRIFLRDAEGFLEDLISISKAQAHTRIPPTLVGFLMEAALDQLVSNLLFMALASNPDFLTAAQLDEIESVICGSGNLPIDQMVATEIAMAGWSLEDMFAGHEDGRLPRTTRREIHEMFAEQHAFQSLFANGLGYLPPMPTSPPRRLASLDDQVAMTKRLYEAFRQMAADPTNGSEPSPIRAMLEEVSDEGGSDRYYIVLGSVSTTRSIASTVHLRRMRMRAARCVIEVHRYRLVTGDWPETLAALREPEVAIDPYTNELFGYEINRDGPKLWAAGPDRDTDGGQALQDRTNGSRWFSFDEWQLLSDSLKSNYDGDVVFFPPEPDREDW